MDDRDGKIEAWLASNKLEADAKSAEKRLSGPPKPVKEERKGHRRREEGRLRRSCQGGRAGRKTW